MRPARPPKACSRMRGDASGWAGAMAVRPARAEDAAALTALMRALAAEMGDPTDLLTPRHVAEDILGDASGIVAVAEGAGAGLVGYATAHPTYETAHAEAGLYVGDLYVRPAHRRRGVAQALLAALARAGHARGAHHLWLTAREGNGAAHALYRRLGARGERVLAFAVTGQDFLNLAALRPR